MTTLLALLSAFACAAHGIHWQPLLEPGCGGAMTSVQVSPHDPKRVLVGGDMLGIGLSVDGGESWGATYGLPSYEIGDFTWHPSKPMTVWAGTMSGPCLSTDGGLHWVLKREGMPPTQWFYSAPIEKVVFDPNDANHLVAAGGSYRRWDSPGTPLWGAIWESRDGGDHWAKLTTLTASGSSSAADTKGVNVISIAFAPRQSSLLYASADRCGVYASLDGGRNWVSRSVGLAHRNVQKVAVHPSDPNHLWVSLDVYRAGSSGPMSPGGVYESLDGGRSWHGRSEGLSQAATNDPNATARYAGLAVSPTDPKRLLVCDTAWNTGVIYRSLDGGAHWNPVAGKGPDAPFHPQTVLPAGVSMSCAAYDPSDPTRAFACNTEFILRTLDGGKTWTDQTAKAVGTQDGLCAGRGYSGWCSWQVRFDPFRRGRVVVQGLDACRAWVSNDSMHSWRYGSGFPTPWQGGRDASWTRSGRLYAVFGQFGSFDGVGRSDDGGKSWTILAGPEHGLPAIGWGNGEPSAVVTDADHDERVWVAINGHVWRSLDGGGRFSQLEVGGSVTSLSTNPAHSGQIVAAGDRGVWVSNDGKTFVSIGGPHPAQRLAVDTHGRIYATSHQTERSGLWRFSAGRWERVLDERFAMGIAVDPTDDTRLAITTTKDPFGDVCEASGVWLSSDRGKTWAKENDGLGMLRGHCIAFDPFTGEDLVFGSFGRGFWRATWPKALHLAGDHSYTTTGEDLGWASQGAR